MAAMVRTMLVILALAAGDAHAQSLGQRIFEQNCKSCHDTGKKDNDAPQLSHIEDWKERYKSGRAVLYRNAVDGLMSYFDMPPRGGNANLSDDEVRAAVDYILERVGIR